MHCKSEERRLQSVATDLERHTKEQFHTEPRLNTEGLLPQFAAGARTKLERRVSGALLQRIVVLAALTIANTRSFEYPKESSIKRAGDTEGDLRTPD